MQSESQNFLQIWCHGCKAHSTAVADVMLCRLCDSPFVEEANQDVESFLSGNNDNFASNTDNSLTHLTSSSSNGLALVAESDISDHSRVLHQILTDLLGTDTDARFRSLTSTDISFLQPNSVGTQRPVGIVVRNAPISLDESSNSISRGILGFLGSLRNARLNTAHNADTLNNAQFEQFLHHILMNENSHQGAPPASQEMLENLVRHTVKSEDDIKLFGECCISQESFEPGEIVVSLPCGHNYKEDPIIQWLKLHSTCPVCRIEMEQPSMNNKST